jgi:hypothetical protein
MVAPRALALFVECDRPAIDTLRLVFGLLRVEPPGIGSALPHQLVQPLLRHVLADTGIERRAVGVGRPVLKRDTACNDGVLDFLARCETGIDETHLAQVLQAPFIVGEMLGLAAYGFFPFEPEPGEILIYRLFVFGAATPLVDVLDPQQEAAADALCRLEGEKRGIGVTEMEPAVRTWGEAEHVSSALVILH